MLKTEALQSNIVSAQDRITIGLVALLLGTFILFGVGFANSEVVHNATHDTRHALAFPCH